MPPPPSCPKRPLVRPRPFLIYSGWIEIVGLLVESQIGNKERGADLSRLTKIL